jgi:hypothetical protein
VMSVTAAQRATEPSSRSWQRILVFGQAAAEHGVHRVHVEQPFAGVGAFAEDVPGKTSRACRAVRVDPRLSREEPVIPA